MFGQDRDSLRRFYLTAWRKHGDGLALEPLEQQVVAVIAEHPEYQHWLAGDDDVLGRDWQPESGESNPFLHMGMHLAIREQLQTDRPPGIAAAYAALTRQEGDAHHAEHRMMECLGQALWEAQRQSREPDPAHYLRQVRRLIRTRS